MAVGRQEIKGTKILNEINSSNIVRTEYDTADKTMITEFKNGTRYEYEDVPHNVYAEFRLSESQGKYFNSKISKVYKYKKLP
jgi:hypothetical protein